MRDRLTFPPHYGKVKAEDEHALNARTWKFLLISIIVIDALIGLGLYYLFFVTDSQAENSPRPQMQAFLVAPTVTPWQGPPTATPIPNLPPTPTATPVLGEAGFPVGFTPTPTPTPAVITLPKLYFGATRWVDVPVVNQMEYPEPFFPPGTNNACGPVSLYAGMRGLGVNISYTHLRNRAVENGFAAHGISQWGLVSTALQVNQDLGTPLRIEYSDRYRTRDLMNHLRRGGVVLVLVYLENIGGRYRMTGYTEGSIGHFLLVENINLRTGRVRLAGSTLGMNDVPLADFLRSWKRNPALTEPPGGWKQYLDSEPASSWALILKKS